jgi:hypothetical protein
MLGDYHPNCFICQLEEKLAAIISSLSTREGGTPLPGKNGNFFHTAGDGPSI